MLAARRMHGPQHLEVNSSRELDLATAAHTLGEKNGTCCLFCTRQHL
jgi:hypothetical protein